MRKQWTWLLGVFFFVVATVSTAVPARAQIASPTDSGKVTHSSRSGQPLMVDGTVALASLVTIGDGHLLKIADELKLLSTRKEVIAGDWAKIKPLLSKLPTGNVQALTWFSDPSGAYRTVEHDRVTMDLRSRPYFQHLLQGRTVIGELVISKSTGRNVAVVAVPVFNQKRVVGALGCSVYLDDLSKRIKEEMALPPNMIFYSFDATPLFAIDWDQAYILKQPKELGGEIERVLREMLKKDEGAMSYNFRGKTRNVLFKKSPITKWWYVVGVVE